MIKYVKIRDFQQNIYKWLKELPIQVTRRGVVIFTVESPPVQSQELKQPIESASDLKKNIIKDAETAKKIASSMPTAGRLELCKKHHVYKASCGCK